MIVRILRLLLCLLSLFIFLFSAIILHILSIFYLRNRWKYFPCLNRVFAASLISICGARVDIQGKNNIPRTGGNLIVSNHLTYLDGVILGSIFPSVFLSKSEVKKWFLIGWMVSISGTIFIDRKKKYDSDKYIEDIIKKLTNKINVILFPEGTSTNGEKINDFQSVFFEVPFVSKSSILPVAIRYAKINGKPVTEQNRDEVCWFGQIPFAKHLWQLLRQKSIDVVVTINPIINLNNINSSLLTRKELAKYIHQIISNTYFKNQEVVAG